MIDPHEPMDYIGHNEVTYEEKLLMKYAAVSKLKATLSECLTRVKAGEELIVLERGKPIAKLVPLRGDSMDGTPHLLELARAGLIRLGTGKLPVEFWKRRRPKDRQGRGVRMLREERAEGR